MVRTTRTVDMAVSPFGSATLVALVSQVFGKEEPQAGNCCEVYGELQKVSS